MQNLVKSTEAHVVSRTGWLRAAVLGANDGIVSTASLILGVAAAAGGMSEVLVAGTAELVAIYVARGVDPALARAVAQQMMAKDALGTHLRDELGHSEASAARPVQAALVSAATFSAGAVLPLLMVLASTPQWLPWTVSVASLGFLALLGALAAWASGAPVARATLRVMFWGTLAMALTAGIGALVGASV